ncbi:unnamed protein product [Rotaria sordida]|uniref:Uncharacterized protein n=1 Tax=Rotaria sordida TaxID=392033 RepID=A0A815S9Z8_9BILA|nr:unnamed protein product [Rotaria sordida]CAF4162523.1 unnamed protein product [Rotaria sordida]
MSSIKPEEIYTNDLPDDIFSYNQDRFYDFIKHSYGNDIAELLIFQAIRNGSHLLITTSDDILSVLQQESDDLNKLKNLCCFQVGNNKYEIKLGIKLALNNLIQLLKIKQEQQKMKKRSSTQRSLSNSNTLTSITQTQTQNETNTSSSTSLTPSISDASSTRARFTPVQKKINEMDHILDIEERINTWWSTTNDDHLYLDEGTHYFLAINKSINDRYTCVLTCQCSIRFKLPFMPGGFFKLSSFYRHIKEKQCIKLSNKIHTTENNSTNKENPSNPSNNSSKLLNAKSKKNKTLSHTTSKRVRSTSREAPSDISNIVKKKNQLSSSNNRDTSPD